VPVLFMVVMVVVGVRVLDWLRAPQENEMPMRCGVGVAVDPAAVSVSCLGHESSVASVG